jgi:sulfite exporter TauE/SafE
MELWTAFLLGMVGSLHCAGMCGPLILALPAAGNTTRSYMLGRLAYNVGRLGVYGLLGAVFGLIGGTFALAGLQRWISLGAGATILIGLLVSSRYAVNTSLAKLSAWVRSGFASIVQRRTLGSTMALGSLNGLLPCGLVYVACTVAVTRSGLLAGVEYMVAFGLGTVPMMLGIGLLGKKLQFTLRLRFQKLIPVCLFLVGALLIVRGLSLGIPYASPILDAHDGHVHACH